MKSNADVDFEINTEDIEKLKNFKRSKAMARAVYSLYMAESFNFIINSGKSIKDDQ